MHNEHTTTELKDSVLEKIQKENISPKAKWQFTLKHATLWIPGVIVTAIGGVAIAGILFGSTHSGFEYREFTNRSPVLFFLQAIPFIWLISFAVFAGSIVKVLRLTSNGYRYKTKAILLTSVTCSIFLGGIIFCIDSDENQNHLIRFPVEQAQTELWSHPEAGRIAGLVELRTDGTVILIDVAGNTWLLNTTGLADTTFLQNNKTVRVLGTQTGEQNFLACQIFPWELSRVHSPMTQSPFPVGKLFPQQQITDCMEILNSLRGGIPNERNSVFVP